MIALRSGVGSSFVMMLRGRFMAGVFTTFTCLLFVLTNPSDSSATAIVTSLRPATDSVPVPEPAAPALLLAAAAALLGVRRTRRGIA